MFRIAVNCQTDQASDAERMDLRRIDWESITSSKKEEEVKEVNLTISSASGEHKSVLILWARMLACKAFFDLGRSAQRRGTARGAGTRGGYEPLEVNSPVFRCSVPTESLQGRKGKRPQASACGGRTASNTSQRYPPP